MRLLTLCGSLRSQSTNRAILRAYEQLAPEKMVIEHDEKIGEISHYNPELDGDSWPGEVVNLRRLVARSDALVLATPEYVHGLPGAFKNVLDWLVGDPAISGKPVAILHTSLGGE